MGAYCEAWACLICSLLLEEFGRRRFTIGPCPIARSLRVLKSLQAPEMRPGMHCVLLNLDIRTVLTRRFGIKRWVCSEKEGTE